MSRGGGSRVRRPKAPGRVLRPKMATLPESAVIPSRNLIEPAPTRFTHRLVRDEPFFLRNPESGAAPAGRLPAGTPVIVRSARGGTCWVVDRRGLRVAVARASVEKTPGA